MRRFLLLALALLASPALAQEVGLSPTLATIKKTHTVRLGYREASPPFSFLDQANRPIGYSLELCEAVVDEIRRAARDPGRALRRLAGGRVRLEQPLGRNALGDGLLDRPPQLVRVVRLDERVEPELLRRVE